MNGINPETQDFIVQNSQLAFNPKAIVKADTFSVKTVMRDPFLGTLTATKTNKKKKIKITKPVDTLKTLKITYSGLIKKQQSSAPIFIINIENNQYLFKKMQTIENVKLLKGNTKEIVVLVNNKLQTITIK